jgi:hypothetical protein
MCKDCGHTISDEERVALWKREMIEHALIAIDGYFEEHVDPMGGSTYPLAVFVLGWHGSTYSPISDDICPPTMVAEMLREMEISLREGK